MARHGARPSPADQACQRDVAALSPYYTARVNPPVDKTRGAVSRPAGRFAQTTREAVDDGWPQDDDAPAPLATQLFVDHARSIISSNTSPDVPFSRSINPIQGCEHGCVYCYARPDHAYRDLSPGLDFETQLFHKPEAAALLRAAFDKPGYQPQTIVIGGSTDAYQPVERQLGLTRQLLQVFLDYRHPVGLITKGGGVLRDLDLLTQLAQLDLVKVMVSVTTLDNTLKRRMEPRTASPGMRLRMIRELSAAGVPTGVLMAPIIPFINDAEIEAVVAAVADAGACEVGYVMLRLPYELHPMFEDWLATHYPARHERVMNRIRDMRGGKAYDSDFAQRMSGRGPYAELIRQRFDLARRRAGLSARQNAARRTDLFRVPGRPHQQGFDF
ncbi:MAG: PA0069 family radical SAM protein [Oceanococcus sp.]|nr:MAG: PA0069 family radical SAM protein [Oceanococcus sp.]